LTVIASAPSASIQVFTEARPKLGEPLVVKVEGELELSTASPFSAALTAAVGAPGRPDVLLDLGRLYRLDPTGLDAIARAAADLAREGRRLVLAAVRPRVREFLAMVGAEALVPMFPTLEEAALHM
jgi:anti-sigma B factor antagonist